MTRVSLATNKGQCWLCAKGAWWHRLFGWALRHTYDPIREECFEEYDRLTKKYAKQREEEKG